MRYDDDVYFSQNNTNNRRRRRRHNRSIIASQISRAAKFQLSLLSVHAPTISTALIYDQTWKQQQQLMLFDFNSENAQKRITITSKPHRI
jgi:hypothetical protein